jgi:hypothetical protein
MTPEKEQETLLKIVEMWRPSERPEYRGFRCAHCQEYKNEGWYHWVNTGGYKLPVHMCKETCEPAFKEGIIQGNEAKRVKINRKTFGNSYVFSQKATERFKEIVSSWPKYKEPELKEFICDNCNKKLLIDADGARKGYHVWWKMPDNNTLAELHFDKTCASILGIEK